LSNDPSADTIETISSASEQPQQQVRLHIDDSDTPLTYSTNVRVWSTPEEINLDFAGPPRSGGNNTARLKIDQRIVLSPWAAKRLALSLAQAVQRYEQSYGTLELDPRKRLVRQGKQGGSQASG